VGLNIPQAMFVLVIQNGGTDAAAGAGSAAADSATACACHSSTDWRHVLHHAGSQLGNVDRAGSRQRVEYR